MHSPGEVIDGRYQIVRLLGKGGLSQVYEAVDLTFNRRCALKEFIVREGGDEERHKVREHFTREMEMLSRLSHPGLPQIYDSLTSEGKDFIALELIDGKTLEELARERSEPFQEEQVGGWSTTILDILDYLHNQSPPVIYRDLKPQNIMITSEGELRFIDFGIARLFNPVKEQDTVFMGTPGFASPEQFRRSQSDPRSDIYSLGALMHYLLTLKDPGLRPFDFEPVSISNPAVSMLMEKVMQKALEIKPDNRFQNAAEMRKVLLGEISFEELSTRGFIIINPKEVQLVGLKPGKESAAEITVRSSRESQKICARLTSEHPGLVVEPSSFDSESATITVRPERRKFRRGRKVTSSITLSTESSKIAIPVTVQYEPTLLGKIPRAYFSLLGFLLPAALFAIFFDRINDLVSSSPVDFLFIIIFYIIIVGGIAFLPTLRKKELKPLALAGNIALVLLPFVFVYLYFYILPKNALNRHNPMTWKSPKSIRSICHRILLWGPDRNALTCIERDGDRSSLPFIIWSYHSNTRRPYPDFDYDRPFCRTAILWIANQKIGETSDEMWEWYLRNRNKTDMELWAEGFRLQGYQVSLKGDTESIDRLLTMIGQKRGLPRDWLIYNGCRMLKHYNSDLVNARVNRAFESGTDAEKAGAKNYCTYLAYRLNQMARKGDTAGLKSLISRYEEISYLNDYISGKVSDINIIYSWIGGTVDNKTTLLHQAANTDIATILIKRGNKINAKDLRGLTPLHNAVFRNKIDMARYLIDNGADIDARDQEGRTPIYITESAEMAELLIAHGADVNNRCNNGSSPLLIALLEYSNYREVRQSDGFFNKLSIIFKDTRKLNKIKLLISRGADVNVKSHDGRAPIHFAISPELFQLLIESGADVNARDRIGQTPLHETMSADKAQLLLKHGADVNARDQLGLTPLHKAYTLKMASLLISHGADINARDNEGKTPLFMMSVNLFYLKWPEPLNIAQLLISHGADVNARDQYGRTPLSCALFRAYHETSMNEEFVTLFRQHGARESVFAFFDAMKKNDRKAMNKLIKEDPKLLNSRNTEGRTPLNEAASDNNCQMAEFLLDRGADQNLHDNSPHQIYPITMAVFNNNIQMAELLISRQKGSKNGLKQGDLICKALEQDYYDMALLLIKAGAEVKPPHRGDATSLHIAAKKGNQDILKALTARGAWINAVDYYGDTPLHEAAEAGTVETAEFLLKQGASINSRNKAGETPYLKAIDNNRKDMAEFLLSKGANPAVSDKRFTPLLHAAASRGHLQIVEMLLSKGAPVDERDSIGWTPLHHAAYGGHADIVKLLLEHGADPNASNESGETPLLCALEKNYGDIADTLKAAGAKDGNHNLLRKQSSDGSRQSGAGSLNQ